MSFFLRHSVCSVRMNAYLCYFDLVLSCGVKVVSPCCRRWRNNLNKPLDPFPFLGGCWIKKAARVEVNILLAFLYWVGIALHPWPFVSDIALFVLKRDVKHQLTNSYPCRLLSVSGWLILFLLKVEISNKWLYILWCPIVLNSCLDCSQICQFDHSHWNDYNVCFHHINMHIAVIFSLKILF